MAIVMISYDLVGDNDESAYTPLIKYLKSIGAVRCLKSQWLVNTAEEPKLIRDKVDSLVTDDRILVATVDRPAAWRRLLNEADCKALLNIA